MEAMLLLLFSAHAATVAYVQEPGRIVLQNDGTTIASLADKPDELLSYLLYGSGDVDGDGDLDALISINPGLGNCCPVSWGFLLLDGVSTLRIVPIPYEGWGEPTLISRADTALEGDLQAQFVGEEGTSAYVMENGQVRRITFTERERLRTLVEVKGPGTPFTAGPPQRMKADLNDDRKKETITCEVWERWGSLLCTLPLPNGQTQTLSTGCVRFGVLETTSNGQHDLVCNSDLVFHFDGSQWVEAP